VDAEQIVLLARLWKALGLPDVELHINSIGDAGERKAHREKLIAYFERHRSLLDEDAKRRLHTNPLRILDSKNPAMQAMIEDAPMLIDELGEGARRHFEGLKRLLDLAGIAYRVNPRIVRGLDYYNRTVFEFISAHVGAQSTIVGGGRYDALFEQLGGKPTPACGFAFGIERLLLAMQSAGAKAEWGPDVFVVHAGEGAFEPAWRVAEALRDSHFKVVLGTGGSMKSQMKRADASGASCAVIIGEDEARSNHVTVKSMRSGEQQTKDLAGAIAFISKINA
jgi:histidyl-tRNA synthetase